MSNKYSTFVPLSFDVSELNRRVTAAQSQIDKHKVLYAPASQALTEYDELLSQGYVRSTVHPVLTHSLDVMQAWVQITMTKPKKVITRELEQIAIETEELYKAEIKASQAEALSRMAARLLAEQEEREVKEAAAHRAQLEASALVEARQILGLSEV